MPDPVWITYAWLDNDEGDFDHLVNQLEASRIPAAYDKIALVPGQRLWDQIAEQITEGQLAGWAYLLTPRSVQSETCREELAYALDRVLNARSEQFPLIGLLKSKGSDSNGIKLSRNCLINNGLLVYIDDASIDLRMHNFPEILGFPSMSASHETHG